MGVAKFAFKSIISIFVGVCILIFANVSMDSKEDIKIALQAFDVLLALSIVAMWL